MPLATGKRPKAVIVKRDVVETAGSFLGTLPEKPKESLSLREAMSNLKEPIRAALAKGYSYQDLAGLLSGQGIDISASTLKNYVPSGKRQSAKESKLAEAPKVKRGRKSQENGEVPLDELAEGVIASVLEAAMAPETKPARASSTRRTAAKSRKTSVKTDSMEKEGETPEEKPRAKPGRKSAGNKTAAKTQSSTTAKAPRSTRTRAAATADEADSKPKTSRSRKQV